MWLFAVCKGLVCSFFWHILQNNFCAPPKSAAEIVGPRTPSQPKFCKWVYCLHLPYLQYCCNASLQGIYNYRVAHIVWLTNHRNRASERVNWAVRMRKIPWTLTLVAMRTIIVSVKEPAAGIATPPIRKQRVWRWRHLGHPNFIHTKLLSCMLINWKWKRQIIPITMKQVNQILSPPPTNVKNQTHTFDVVDFRSIKLQKS